MKQELIINYLIDQSKISIDPYERLSYIKQLMKDLKCTTATQLSMKLEKKYDVHISRHSLRDWLVYQKISEKEYKAKIKVKGKAEIFRELRTEGFKDRSRNTVNNDLNDVLQQTIKKVYGYRCTVENIRETYDLLIELENACRTLRGKFDASHR